MDHPARDDGGPAAPGRGRAWRAAGAGALAAVAAAVLSWGLWAGLRPAPRPRPRPFDVVFLPTPQPVVDQMLELAAVKPGDVLYDLGCGDGRIVVTAAKRYGVRAVGLDIDPNRVAEARENARRNGVADLVTVEVRDVFQADLSGATVVTMYLMPHLNVRLMPRLARLRPGSRIVSYSFDMRGARPTAVEPARAPDTITGIPQRVYLWVVPWEPEPAAPPGGASAATP
jgi:SAM-dependent methyltransferase